MDNQVCKVCNKIDYFNFDVPDKIWRKIVPYEYKNKVVCLPCFDKFATEKHIRYAKYIGKDFYFVGETGTLIFETKERIDK